MAKYVKTHKLPKAPTNKNMRPMIAEDVPRVTEMLNEYLSGVKVHIIFTEEEVAHFMLPRENVIYSYVVDNETTITDFYSFYNLPSTIL